MFENGNIPAFFIAHPDSLKTFAKHNSKHTRIDALLQIATSDYRDQFSSHMLTTILRDIKWKDVRQHYSTLLRKHQHFRNLPNNNRQEDNQSDDDDQVDEVDEENEQYYQTLIRTESDFARYAALSLLQWQYGIITLDDALLQVLEIFFRLDPATDTDVLSKCPYFGIFDVVVKTSAHLPLYFRKYNSSMLDEKYFIAIPVAYQIMATFALRFNLVAVFQALCNMPLWGDMHYSMGILFFKNLAMANHQTLHWFESFHFRKQDGFKYMEPYFYQDKHVAS
eukprot:5788046-Pleurochrysis_carterae.AAC.1